MNTLYWVRHGENLANLTLEFSHRKVDYSLTPKGILQAQQTAGYFRARDIDEIYTSPLKRARETAEIIAAPHNLPVLEVENFREVNVGDLEGQKPTAALWDFHDQIVNAWKNGHPELCFPGGENFQALINRFQTGLQEILSGKDGCNIIIVGHGGLFNLALPHICPEINPFLLKTGIGNCSVTEIQSVEEAGRFTNCLISFSSTTHLNGHAAHLVPGLPPQG